MGSYLFSPQVALLTEHLEHTPITLIDEIINSINVMVTNSLNVFENTINNTPKLFGYPEGPNGPGSLSAESQHEITNGMHQLETLLGALIDKNFDKFEIYVLRNVLAIPEGLVGWIRLSHHKGLEFKLNLTDAPSSDNSAATSSVSNEGFSWYHPTQPTNETFTRLREKLIATHYLNQTLKTEAASNAALISKLKAALALTTAISSSNEATTSSAPTSTTSPPSPPSSISFLSTSTPLPLPTTAEFIASQISSIRSLLSSIQPKLDTFHSTTTSSLLRSSSDDDDDNNDPLPLPDLTSLNDLDPSNPNISPTQRRQRYIEKMTRRHMQKQRRLKLTARGEIVGGEYWDGVAAGDGGSGVGAGGEKRRDLEEVQALEAIFGGSASGSGAESGTEKDGWGGKKK